MSWAASVTGNKTGVRNAIDAEQHIPEVVKDAMKAIVGAIPDNPKMMLTLETNGHIDPSAQHDYSGGNVTFKLSTVKHVTE